MSVVRTEEAALLRAVLGRPDDDVPRLVLADWLDEHGQPERAEFVRVQCEANRNPAGCFHDITSPPDCRTCALHLRAKALSLEWVDGGINWERWSGLPDVGWACLNIAGGLALAGGRTAEWNHFRYRCGFVESIVPPLSGCDDANPVGEIRYGIGSRRKCRVRTPRNSREIPRAAG